MPLNVFVGERVPAREAPPCRLPGGGIGIHGRICDDGRQRGAIDTPFLVDYDGMVVGGGGVVQANEIKRCGRTANSFSDKERGTRCVRCCLTGKG
jgi:hypothetical protein